MLRVNHMPTKKELLEEKTVKELHQMAKDKDLSGYSRLPKDELVEMIEDNYLKKEIKKWPDLEDEEESTDETKEETEKDIEETTTETKSEEELEVPTEEVETEELKEPEGVETREIEADEITPSPESPEIQKEQTQTMQRIEERAENETQQVDPGIERIDDEEVGEGYKEVKNPDVESRELDTMKVTVIGVIVAVIILVIILWQTGVIF